MNKQKLLTISILPGMWLIYILFELFSGNLNETSTLVFNIILLPFLALIGILFSKISEKHKNGFNSKQLIKFSIILIAIDQITKIIIKFFFFEEKFYIIPKTLSFNPIINTTGSWLNVRFNTNISFSMLILVNFIALIFFIEIYRYIKNKNIKDFWTDSCFIFIFAGSFCSLVDKLFYGGSLDFIGVGSLFIADYKDIFINLAIFFFLLACYKNGFFAEDNNSTLKDDLKELKKFFKFLKEDFKLIKRKK
ncbi:MAG: signal peptidase II [Sarcina sp.]